MHSYVRVCASFVLVWSAWACVCACMHVVRGVHKHKHAYTHSPHAHAHTIQAHARTPINTHTHTCWGLRFGMVAVFRTVPKHFSQLGCGICCCVVLLWRVRQTQNIVCSTVSAKVLCTNEQRCAGDTMHTTVTNTAKTNYL